MVIKDAYNNEVGVIFYSIYPDNSCFIDTLFVSKESRNKGYAKALLEQIIKIEDPISFVGSVDMRAHGAEDTLSTISAYGCKTINEVNNNMILEIKLK